LLQVDKLFKQYGNVVAVEGISFKAGKGSVFGLLGPNGAGKSTTINCISGLLRASSGTVTVGDFDIARESRSAKQLLGIVPQELALYEDLPAIDNLRFWGKAYGLRGDDLEARVNEVLATVGLADRARELPKTFSGGMKRRLNFACGVVHKPPVILLDEPTAGVDPQSRNKIFELVRAARDGGACILYTTHYMEEAETLCDSLAIIDHGKMIATGTVDQLRAQLGARDVLHLSGRFPSEAVRTGIAKLVAGGLHDLEILAQQELELTLTLSGGSQHLPDIFAALAAAGGHVKETNLRSPNLETLFLLLTGKELRE